MRGEKSCQLGNNSSLNFTTFANILHIVDKQDRMECNFPNKVQYTEIRSMLYDAHSLSREEKLYCTVYIQS